MKFGTVPDSTLDRLDLSLPAEPFINTLVLTGLRAREPRIAIGAGTWGAPGWSGMVYPPKTPATRFRQLYPRYFGAIELNATHYRIYPPEVLRQWATAARGSNFRYCPKFPREISHQQGLRQADDSTALFLESIRALQPNLGPAFLQLPETFSPRQQDELYFYLSTLPADLPFFLELRQAQWFEDEQTREALFTHLREAGIGAVITDTPARRDAVHMFLTLPKVLIRFVCNGLHSTSFTRSDEWIAKLAQWIDAGLEEAYVFLHPGNDDAVPELASYWSRRLSEKTGLALPDPLAARRGLFDL
jgi:uncharacterized protein YecE (DUF72 family)